MYDESFCNTFLKKFKPCLTPVLEATAKCTTPFTNSLNIAVVDATLSEIEFLCNSDGEHILGRYIVLDPLWSENTVEIQTSLFYRVWSEIHLKQHGPTLQLLRRILFKLLDLLKFLSTKWQLQLGEQKKGLIRRIPCFIDDCSNNSERLLKDFKTDKKNVH